MIKTIELENFQSHKKSKLEFDKAVNIIIGSTDCGKTAIVRALNWVINNRPLGESFRSNWGGDTSVFVSTDRNELGRIKQNKYSCYVIDKDELKAFDKSVPEEIQKAFNFSEINLQRQLDGPFLLSETPGEVQRILNRIAHLDKIDDSMAVIEKNRRKVSSDLEHVAEEIILIGEELKNYDGIEKLKEQINSFKEKEDIRNRFIYQFPLLESIIKEIKEYELSINKLKNILEFEDRIDILIDKIDSYSINSKQKDELEEILSDIIESNNKIEKLKRLYEIDISGLLEKINKHEDNKKKEEHLTELLKGLNDIIELSISIQTALKKMEFLYDKEFPDVCPLCGQEIK